MESVTLVKLVIIADAIEREAVRRYELLERTMRRRGEIETADAFRLMLAEEREHVANVAQWAARLDVAVPDAGEYEWVLPAELATSWEEIAGSALLTPYRAFAIAVENELRAFSFYSYLAAHAADRTVAIEAERLAAEELNHAARIRRWRREAYHRERGQGGPHPEGATQTADRAREAARSPAALQAFLDARQARIGADYHRLAARLRALGDDSSAALLDAFVAAHLPRAAATPVAPTGSLDEGGAVETTGGTDAPEAAPTGDASEAPAPVAAARTSAEVDSVAEDDGASSLSLLVAAQRPLEALGEALDHILSVATDETFHLAEQASNDVVAWLARIALARERRA